MKLLMMCVLLAAGSQSVAQTVVHGSIYMALGPARPSYFDQIQQTLKAVAATGYPKMESFELNQLRFSGAVVTGTRVRYNYNLTHQTGGSYDPVCSLQVSLEVESTKAQLLDVKADYTCEEWDD